MSSTLLDMARTAVVGVPGTGPITLGTAIPGYQTPAQAGATNGITVSYGIKDVNNTWEVGRATYTTAGPSITRGPLFSSSGNAAISCTSAAQVYLTTLAGDFGGNAVTAVVAGTGLEVGSTPGGTITATGTLNVTPATTAALGGIIAGANTTINAGGTLSVSAGGGGGITSIVAGTGLVGGTITTSGTITNAGVLAIGATAGSIVLGPNLSMTGQTLEVSAPGTGTVTSVVAGTGLAGGTITGSGTITNAGVVHFGGVTGDVSLGANLAMTGQTLEVTGTVGFVTSLGGETGSIAVDGGLVASGQTLFGTITSGSNIGMVSVNGSGVMFSPTGSSDLQAAHIGLGQGFNSGTLYVLSMSGAGGVGLLGFGGAYPGIGLAATGAPSTLNNTGVLTFGGVTGDIATGPGLTIVAGNTLEVTPATTAALGGVIVGSGLSVSAGGTISNTGTGSGGTVTSVVAGTGLSGGTITTSGTVAFATIAAGDFLANTGTVTAAPTATAMGTLTAGTGLSGGPFTPASGGTISNAGVLAVGATAGSIVLGTNLSMSGQTLNVSAGAGGVTSVIAGLGLAGGTITSTGTITLDVATTAALGGIIVGSGVTINGGGTLSVAAPGTGTVTSVATGAGLSGGPITGAGTIVNTGVLAVGATSGSIVLGAHLAMTGSTLDTTGYGTMAVQNSNSVSITGGTITGMPTPSASTDVANKAYVDSVAAGLNPAVAVQVATATILPNSPTYNNGAAGIGAFITTTTLNTALVIDGQTINTLGQRVLVKNEAGGGGLGAPANGVYSLTQIIGVAAAWILTRALDYDQPSDMNNTGAIPVVLGTANAQTSWVLTSQITTVGTDPLTFTQYTLNPTTIVQGPASATSGNIAIFSGTSGKLIADGGAPSSGTVTSIVAGAGLGGGTITGAGTITNTGLIEFLSGTVATTGTVTIGTGLALSSNTLSATASSPSFSDTISAAGTVQGTATTITSNINVVTVAAANSGVRLTLNPTPGFTQQVFDRGANNLNVYPASGATIETLGANTAAVVVAGGVATFTAQTTTQWLAS